MEEVEIIIFFIDLRIKESRKALEIDPRKKERAKRKKAEKKKKKVREEQIGANLLEEGKCGREKEILLVNKATTNFFSLFF